MRRLLTINTLTIFLIKFLCLSQLAGVLAAPGDLDTPFAATGISRTGFSSGDDEVNAAAEQAYGVATAGNAASLSPDAESAAPKVLTPRPPLAFSLAHINAQVVKEFQKAWSLTAGGSRDVEAVVLLFRLPGGSYIARSQRFTNERKKFTFRWIPNVIAIVHTHPNGENPEPSGQDEVIAEKYGVPVFTITATGMYMYDPKTGQTSLVKPGLDWHDPAKWLL